MSGTLGGAPVPGGAGASPAAWLARAEPPPPASLAGRVAALLGDAPMAGGPEAVARCVDGAERVVAGLLRDGCTARDSALDLLAADALATYAFELAGERPETLAAVADAAMARFAALGLTPPAPPGPASPDLASPDLASPGPAAAA